ncbi:hypothetical protein B0H63DRAFT_452582 [Podospora didyma]|uniref:Uncharacterized protein n=1 Tax=Podospora didyma TaxID=330526 RepID=A0AAE0N8J4_9PEZI|nr:hypothetical protein B0H63DRAFT_452582 [Podospora didyma]
MHFNILATVTFLVVGLASGTAISPQLAEVGLLRPRTCGTPLGACDNGCEGINNPITNIGVCTAGNGIQRALQRQRLRRPERPNGGQGTCTAGNFNGCFCNSICGTNNGNCNAKNCAGVNGVCTGGNLKECRCNGSG